jgi:hypothetical protein
MRICFQDRKLNKSCRSSEKPSSTRSLFSRVISFTRSDGRRDYSLFAYPIRDPKGKVEAVLTVGFDVPPSAAQGR